MGLAETHNKIEDTMSHMLETRFQIRALDEPLENCSTCSSWRSKRSPREQIADPVSTKLREHQLTISRAQQDLVGHHSSEQENLSKLHLRKDALVDDLRDKRTAMDIDTTCSTYEATVSWRRSQCKNMPKGSLYGGLAMKPNTPDSSKGMLYGELAMKPIST